VNDHRESVDYYVLMCIGWVGVVGSGFGCVYYVPGDSGNDARVPFGMSVPQSSQLCWGGDMDCRRLMRVPMRMRM
jgi:hypothetical protein